VAGSVEHGKVVLSAIVFGGGSLRALDYARTRLTPEHFTDTVQRALFVFLQRYADQSRGILPRKTLADVLRDQAPGRAQQFMEYYDLVAEAEPELHEFKHSVAQLRELAAEQATGDALRQGIEILRSGAYADDEKTWLKGHEDARAHVLAAFAAAESAHGTAESPEGDVRNEGKDIMARYAKAKELRLRNRSPGIAFGIGELDRRLPAGALPGSLSLVLGWTSAGKTSYCVNWAHHAAVMQGRDVVYFTTETLRPQVSAKLIARHSRLPQFGLPQGLNSAAIQAGRLTDTEETAFQQVLADFGGAGYGKVWLVQCPRRATASTIESRLAAISRSFTPGLVIMDYAQLLAPERAGRESRTSENLAGVVKDLKQVSAAFNGGEGVPIVTPWQVSREGYRSKKATGAYDLLDVAETKEAADTADLVIALIDPASDDTRGRAVPITASVIKCRDGERNFSAELTADFATSFFDSRNVTLTADALGIGDLT